MSPTHYIEAVQLALEAAHKLTAAIATDEKRHGDSCVMTDQGATGPALEALKESLAQVRRADDRITRRAA